MRQIGLIVILAQVGCLVPAKYAKLGITDRIFTRVGAVDDVSLGQSTFQVEMAETAVILARATPRSLVLLDEIGRGTSVSDGIAIAWAVAEHMAGLRSTRSGPVPVRIASGRVPRTIFVTHYHELNELGVLPNVLPFRVQMVRATSSISKSASRPVETEVAEEWVCSHRILPGASWESHGISIARRAGFPLEVIARAEHVLETLRKPSKEFSRYLRLAFGRCTEPNVGQISYDDDDLQAEEGNPDCSSSEYEAGYQAGLTAGRVAALHDMDAALQQLIDAALPGAQPQGDTLQ
jgi:DNA mismatch repair protein MutS